MASFVEPGRQLELRVELTAFDERDCVFKGVGVIDGQEMVKGRFILTRYNLRDQRRRASRNRFLDRCRPSRPVLNPAERFGRSQGDRAEAGACRDPYTRLGRKTCEHEPFLMMLQRFAVLLMMCRIPAPTSGGCLPGVSVRNDIPQRSPI